MSLTFDPCEDVAAPFLNPGSAPGASREESVARALEMTANTMPTDVTGHPALNVPCAVSGGLPVGMMLIGRRGEEATLLRAAHAFEQQVFAAPPVATAAVPVSA